jgi:hypothetical protein
LLVVRTETLSLTGPDAAEAECRRCGGRLGEGQEWCLECGAARTLLRPPPDWRIPLALLVLLMALAVVVLVVLVVSVVSIQG